MKKPYDKPVSTIVELSLNVSVCTTSLASDSADNSTILSPRRRYNRYADIEDEEELYY